MAKLEAIASPDICCCCLEPTQVKRYEKLVTHFAHTAVGMSQRYLLVPLGWCGPCRRRTGLLLAATILAFIAGTLGSMFLWVVTLDNDFNEKFLVVLLIPGGVVAWIARSLLARALGNRPGHVRSCMAVEGRRGTEPADGAPAEIRIVFGNRAYAALWKRANGLS